MAEKMSTGEVRQQFSELVNRSGYGGERIVLTRRGRDLAALVSMADLELLQKLEDVMDAADVRAALRETQEEGAISWEELKAELGLPSAIGWR
jgi:prevent-host-death family protein